MRNTKVKTRKEHRCYACLRKFPARTEMINWMNIYEGEFCYGYTCMTCEKAANLSAEYEFPEEWMKEICDYEQLTPEGVLTKMIEEKCKLISAQIFTSATQT